MYGASFDSKALAVFDRDPLTGELTQKPGAAGCLQETGLGGCQDARGIEGATAVTVSPDGATVYAGSRSDNAVTAFDRFVRTCANHAFVDLAVSVTADPTTTTTGSTVTYTVQLSNAGPCTAVNSETTVTLPAGFGVGSATPSAGVFDQGTGIWTVPSLAGDASPVTLTIEGTFSSAGTKTADAEVTSVGTAEPNDGPLPSDSVDVTVTGVPSAAVTGAGPASVEVGSPIALSYDVTNNGTSALTGVALADADAPECDTVIGNLAIGATEQVTCQHPTATADLPAPRKQGSASFAAVVTSNEAADVTAAAVDVAVTLPGHPFNDVPAWVADAVDWMAFHQYATGFPGGGYQPDGNITRGQLSRMLYRFDGSPDVSGLPGHGFGDVPAWLTDAVKWMTADLDGIGPGQPLATGYPDGTYKPGNDITRAQVARMLYRYSGSPDVSGFPAHGFGDVPLWVEDPVRWLAADPDGAGPLPPLISGFPDGTFKPDDPITRAQFTRMLYRYCLAFPPP